MITSGWAESWDFKVGDSFTVASWPMTLEIVGVHETPDCIIYDTKEVTK